MTSYQVVARRFRPQTFTEVIGQDPIVQTLKNALKFDRIAHAYLFCGSRGTGKTTLARIFAKILNCEHISPELEPCNLCRSCKEISQGMSLDVLEIDGASNRGIDDIRLINDSAGYSPSRGRFKIYIIDEVHMLTKEAFNALLKTLEEPPPQVKFLFATTEPHKIPQTILSRCQRFNLKRISLEQIQQKLQKIASQLQVEVEDGALKRVAQYAEGGLRDAESLFDQLVSFSNGKLSADAVDDLLGSVSKQWFFSFDQAFHKQKVANAFSMAADVFLGGKDILHFLDDFLDHFRQILRIKLCPEIGLQNMDTSLQQHYQTSASYYSQDQLLTILDYILEIQQTIKSSVSQQIALECLLLKILRLPFCLPVEILVKKLNELEGSLIKLKEEGSLEQNILTPVSSIQVPQHTSASPQPENRQENSTFSQQQLFSEKNPSQAISAVKPITSLDNSILPEAKSPTTLKEKTVAAPTPKTVTKNIPPATQSPQDSMQRKNKYDTLIQFAAVELDGMIQRKQNPRS